MRAWLVFAGYLIAEAILITSPQNVEPYSRSMRTIVFCVLGVGFVFDAIELWLKARAAKLKPCLI